MNSIIIVKREVTYKENGLRLSLQGTVENIPWSICLTETLKGAQWCVGSLDGVGWFSNTTEGLAEKWNVATCFTDVINQFLLLADDIQKDYTKYLPE